MIFQINNIKRELGILNEDSVFHNGFSSRYPRMSQKGVRRSVRAWGPPQLDLHLFLKNWPMTACGFKYTYECHQFKSLNGQGTQTLIRNKLFIRILATPQSRALFPSGRMILWGHNISYSIYVYCYTIHIRKWTVTLKEKTGEMLDQSSKEYPVFVFWPKCIENIFN